MIEFIKKKSLIIPILLLAGIIFTLLNSYSSQQTALTKQMDKNSENINNSVKFSVTKFLYTQKIINLELLLNKLHSNLDIFEFRFLDRNGTILKSMSKEEIGKHFDLLGAYKKRRYPLKISW